MRGDFSHTVRSKQQLEHFPLPELAVLCKQVADNPKEYTEAAANEADKLTWRWFSLQRPPSSNSKEEVEMERKRAELKKRIVEFLADTL